MQNYFSVIGFILGLLYVYVLIKYSSSNWVKSIAIIGLVYSLLLIPYRFIVFRTNITAGNPNYTNFIMNLGTCMLIIAIVILLMSTVILFIRNIPLSIKIYFFVTSALGVLSTPMIYQVIVQLIIRTYDFNTFTRFNNIFSSISLIFSLLRAYVAYVLIKEAEDNQKENVVTPYLKPDYKY